jgi:hypothetical protein
MAATRVMKGGSSLSVSCSVQKHGNSFSGLLGNVEEVSELWHHTLPVPVS